MRGKCGEYILVVNMQDNDDEVTVSRTTDECRRVQKQLFETEMCEETDKLAIRSPRGLLLAVQCFILFYAVARCTSLVVDALWDGHVHVLC